MSKSPIALHSYLSAIKSTFRVNLRIFANISTLCIIFWLFIFAIYHVANLSETWLAIFTGFTALPFLLTLMQDTMEVGPFEFQKLDSTKLDLVKQGSLTLVSLFLHIVIKHIGG